MAVISTDSYSPYGIACLRCNDSTATRLDVVLAGHRASQHSLSAEGFLEELKSLPSLGSKKAVRQTKLKEQK
jgi:hypothetical protein